MGERRNSVRSQEISKTSVSQRQDLRCTISVDQLPVSAPSHTVALLIVSLLHPPLRMQSSTVPCRSPVPLHSLLPQIHRPHRAGKQTTSRLLQRTRSLCLKKPPNLFAGSDTPVELPVPRNVDEFHQGGARAGSKRNRRNEELWNLYSISDHLKDRRGLREKCQRRSLSSRLSPIQTFDRHSGNLKCGMPSSVTVYFLRGQGLTDLTSPLQTGMRNFHCKTFRGINLHGCARSVVL